MRSCTTAELAQKLAAGDARVIDVREVDEFAAGHVPEALNRPLSNLTESFLAGDALSDLTDGDFLICQSGNRSARACEMLATRGIDAINVTGGMLSWQGDIAR
ncbi:MAG: rhodanese-like domain-containing protein [Streptococcaceae bacterium]|jgi:rhodanese-related sulfurtransferase|nr:rhodanese-like domain-containing protein [Streptococcaceae bacterium]